MKSSDFVSSSYYLNADEEVGHHLSEAMPALDIQIGLVETPSRHDLLVVEKRLAVLTTYSNEQIITSYLTDKKQKQK